jgi:glycosyltransferase involved in cell wall biosynthesis
MRISFVIPSLNEREGIRDSLDKIPKAGLEAIGHEVEILVIDGASTDGTADVARAWGAQVIVEERRGYGRAYKTGFAQSHGDVVITGDADGSYPFDDAPLILKRFEANGFDFFTMDRFAHLEPGSMTFMHKVGNWVLSGVTRLLFGIQLHDSQSGMWVIRRRALQILPYESFSDKMPFSEELKIMAFRTRVLKCAELPGRYLPRLGRAKLSSWKDGLMNLGYLFRLRFRKAPTLPRASPST